MNQTLERLGSFEINMEGMCNLKTNIFPQQYRTRKATELLWLHNWLQQAEHSTCFAAGVGQRPAEIHSAGEAKATRDTAESRTTGSSEEQSEHTAKRQTGSVSLPLNCPITRQK